MYSKALFVLQATASGYECLVHLMTPPVRISAMRLDQNTVVCNTFQVTYFIILLTSSVTGPE